MFSHRWRGGWKIGDKSGAVFTAAGCHGGIPPGSQTKHVQNWSSKGHKQWADKVFWGYQVFQGKTFSPVKLKAICEEMQEALMILKGKWISTLINIKQYVWENLLSFIYTEICSELFITEKEIFKLWETGFMKVAAQFSVASPKEYSKTRKLTENVPNVFKSTSSTQRTVTQTKTRMSPQKRWMKQCDRSL